MEPCEFLMVLMWYERRSGGSQILIVKEIEVSSEGQQDCFEVPFLGGETMQEK